MIKLTLGQHEIHVWSADLNVSQQLLKALENTLEVKEMDRANRFHFEKDRRHFIAARGILRVILGRYLKLKPDSLKFIYTPHGKPKIPNELDQNYLKFNLSHSHGHALYAITSGREIGIDIERVRANLSVEKIAKRFFSPLEFKMLNALPPSERIEGFFNCWTRKEAYIKAIGEGLSIPLNQFDVTLNPSDQAKIVSIRGDSTLASNWSLYPLTPAPGYVGALAVEGKNLTIKHWIWPE
ncbi:MAG: 4'-phosphopantetheinyl transferase superfamily protein [Thermodesulfobacteriota bacterium]